MLYQYFNRRLRATPIAIGAFGMLLAGTMWAEDARQPGTDPSSTSASENSQLRSELEQLKQVVLQQQSRINALERQQVTGPPAPGASEMTDLLSSSGVLTDPQAPAAPPQQKAPQTATFQADQNAGSSDSRIRNL